MNCENCCEDFIGTYEGFYFVKDNNRKRLCRCCKNEYIALGGLGWKFMGSVEDIELVKKKELCKCCGKKHGDDECEGVNCGACNDHDYFPLTLLDGVMRCGFCVDDYNNGLECEEDDDGFEDCNVCGYAHHYEDKCPNETTCEHYEKSEKAGEHIDEMTFEDLCEYVNDMDGSDVSEGWGRDEIIAMIKEMNK